MMIKRRNNIGVPISVIEHALTVVITFFFFFTDTEDGTHAMPRV